jgi:hypothetical protein
VKYRLRSLRRLGSASLLALGSVAISFAQAPFSATRMWSVGPLTKSDSVTGITLGAGGASIGGPHLDSQTESIFAATRSVVFAGERIVIALRSGVQMPRQDFRLLSLDAKTGDVKDSREFVDFGIRAIFATNDAHVVVSGTSVLRLTPDLKDDGSFDYHATGQKHGRVQNVSPDGSTLGNATSPGFELINAQTLKGTELTANASVDTPENRGAGQRRACRSSSLPIPRYPAAPECHFRSASTTGSTRDSPRATTGIAPPGCAPSKSKGENCSPRGFRGTRCWASLRSMLMLAAESPCLFPVAAPTRQRFGPETKVFCRSWVP